MNKFISVKKNEMKHKIVEHMNDSASEMGEHHGPSSSEMGEHHGPSSSEMSEYMNHSSSKMGEHMNNPPSKSSPSSSNTLPAVTCSTGNASTFETINNSSLCIKNENNYKIITNSAFTGFAANAKCVNGAPPKTQTILKDGKNVLQYKC